MPDTDASRSLGDRSSGRSKNAPNSLSYRRSHTCDEGTEIGPGRRSSASAGCRSILRPIPWTRAAYRRNKQARASESPFANLASNSSSVTSVVSGRLAAEALKLSSRSLVRARGRLRSVTDELKVKIYYNERSLFDNKLSSGFSWTWEGDRLCVFCA